MSAGLAQQVTGLPEPATQLLEPGMNSYEELTRPSAVDPDCGAERIASIESLSIRRRQELFRDALLMGCESTCREMILALTCLGFSYTAAADLLITDAMRQFGHLWDQGELAIYQERRACMICHGLIHELKQIVSVGGNGPIAIGGSPSGDVYQLPTQLVELALCENGWRATSLGCNLPLSTFSEAAKEYRPRLLWVSLSDVLCEDAMVSDFNQMADTLPLETALIIGGRAFTDSLRARLRYTAQCDSLAQLGVLSAAFRAKQS